MMRERRRDRHRERRKDVGEVRDKEREVEILDEGKI